MSAEAFVSRFLRLPRVLAERAQLPTTVKVMPADFDFASNREAVVGVRLRDAFASAAALVLNERWYVVNALRHAVTTAVFPCADRDPVLVLGGFKEVADTISTTVAKIKLFQLDGLDLEVFGGADQLPTPEQVKYIATQLYTASTSNLPDAHPCRSIEMLPFKNYRLVPYGGKSMFSWCTENLKGCFVMPLAAIISDKYKTKMATVTIAKPHDAFAVGKLVAEVVPFVHVLSKNAVRILVDEWSPTVVDKLKKVQGVQRVAKDSDVLEDKVATFERQAAITGRTTSTSVPLRVVGALELRISTTDNSPIDDAVGPKLAEFLRCRFIRMVGGVMWAEAPSAELAEMLHERQVGHLYRVLWPKAPGAQSN